MRWAGVFFLVCVFGCGIKEEARKGGTLQLLNQLQSAAETYQVDHGAYPAEGNTNLVAALRMRSAKDQPYLDFKPKMLNQKGEIIDGWLRPIVYRKKGERWEVYSFGSNEKDDGGEGDDLRLIFR